MNNTHSLPVQNVDASDASHATTPRSSSGRPSRPSGFDFDHFSNSSGCLSKYAAVILHHPRLQKPIARRQHIIIQSRSGVSAYLITPVASQAQPPAQFTHDV